MFRLGQTLHWQVQFFENVLARIKPKAVIILCYYSNITSFAVTAAANRLGIRTVELQHGPMSTTHLGYGSWTQMPPKGYDLIPRIFWCWEAHTASFLDSWSGEGSRLYRTEIGGHPWLDYLREKEKTAEADIVLYTLQPEPLSLDALFTDAIVELIAAKREKWYVRMHPRQVPIREKITAYLEAKGILEFVNLEEGTFTDLPSLLGRTRIHVTHSSGCVLEASILGVPSLIINKIGASYYKSLIQTGDAVSLDYKAPNFKAEFYKFYENVSRSKVSRPIDYSETIRTLLD